MKLPRLLLALLLFSTVLAAASPLPVRAETLSIGGTAQVITDDGTGLNLREEPTRTADAVGTANEGDTVEVLDGPYADENGDDWYLVQAADATGYAIAEFLVASDGPATPIDSTEAFQFSAADVGVVPILMYHHIDYSGGTYAVTPEQLAAQLDWLAANGYTGITLTQFFNGAFAGALLPAKPVVLTVDDGWASALTFADLLGQYGFVGNYFINTESELTPDQIAYLGQIGEVENHTVSHAALSSLGYDDQYWQIANNSDYLQSLTGQSVQFIAWPYGDWNASAVQAASDAGLIGAFDAWGGPAYLSSLDPWHLPRILIDGSYDLDTFARVVTA